MIIGVLVAFCMFESSRFCLVVCASDEEYEKPELLHIRGRHDEHIGRAVTHKVS